LDLGRAAQGRELQDDELDAVTGAWNAVEHGAVTGCTKANGSGFMARGIGNSNGPSDERRALGTRMKIMSKTTLRNVKASVEVRELKDELSEAERRSLAER
jgi:hypothetical protein